MRKVGDVEETGEISKVQGNKDSPILVVSADGFYKFHLFVTSEKKNYNVNVHVEVRQYYGYLSAADYPSLHVSVDLDF